MDKLFEAIRIQHPGFEVVDVKFLVNQREVNGQDSGCLDVELARAVSEAEGPFMPGPLV